MLNFHSSTPVPTTERMKDWLIRQINSGKFPGLEWLNEEKNVFKVPWIHAKKRGYNKERDNALFRAWAIHSGKYRDGLDPTVLKINFRCAINGLKNIDVWSLGITLVGNYVTTCTWHAILFMGPSTR